MYKTLDSLENKLKLEKKIILELFYCWFSITIVLNELLN